MSIDDSHVYASVANSRNTDASLRWSRAQLFLLVNTASLTAVPFIAGHLSDLKSLMYLSIVGISVFGFLMSLLWYLITHRANKWVDFWNDRLREIEEATFAGRSAPSTRVFSHPKFASHSWHAPSFHHSLVWLAGSFMIVWLLIFFFRRDGVHYRN